MTYHRTTTIILCAAAVFLAACQKSDTEPSGSATLPLKSVPKAAWLIDRLPPETVGYLRIPSLWNALFEPKEDGLHNAQAQEENLRQLEAIKQGLSNNLWNLLPAQAIGPVQLLLEKMSTPLEVAALIPPDGSFVPNVLMGTTLEGVDRAGFGQLIEQLTALNPQQVRVLTPMDDAGYMTLFAGPMPLYMHFSEASGRLSMLSGASATQDSLTAMTDGPETESPLRQHESGLDAVGRGLAVWVDMDRIWPMVAPMAPPEQAAMVSATGLDQLDYLYLGSVASGGKASLVAHLQMPRVGFRQLLPVVSGVPDVTSAGVPDFAVRIVLPTQQEFEQALDYVLAQSEDSDSARKELAGFKDLVDQYLGFDSARILVGYGPDIMLVSDRAGYWVAYEIRDRAAHDEMTAALVEKTGSPIQQRNIGGQTLYHWPMNTMTLLETDTLPDTVIPPVVKQVFGNLREHVFWVDEGRYSVGASVPQVLMARHSLDDPVDVGRWIGDSLQIDWSHTVIGGAARTRNVSRNIYHFYLQMLLFMGDMAGAELDPFAMPIWTDAGLAEEGRLGFRIDSSESALRLQLDYEVSPLEAVIAGNTMTSVAVVGILAAIAIPAYVDYEARAAVSGALSAAGLVREQVSESYYANGTLPAAGESLTEALGQASSASRDVYYEDGVISIYFSAGAKKALQGKSLHLEASEGEGGLEWTCYSPDIPENQLPVSCRG